MTQTILGDVAQYYGDKLRQHGATPAGVDWKDESSQILRFEQLLRVVTDPRGSVIDFGCGFGALLGNMRGKGFVGDYLGIDIASDMIETAASKYATDRKARFETGSSPSTQADYTVASGIFNVSMHHDKDAWKDYVAATLADMNASSRFGFAFNCLTAYSDADKMRSNLYYGDPCFWFDLCKRTYSRQVALLHDYGLYEFTIIVRKE
jgi:SAM-dependent methyltransferase